MNQHLRDRINRKLDALPDERAYQILDFIEFLESRYAARQNPSNVFTRFADTVEDGLRAGRVSTSAIAESMSLMNKAMGVLGGVAAAGKTVAGDIVATAREAGKQVSGLAGSDSSAAGTQAASTSSGTAAAPGVGETRAPGSAPTASPNAAAPATENSADNTRTGSGS